MVYTINKFRYIPTTGLKPKPTYEEVDRDRLSSAILHSFFHRRMSARDIKDIKDIKRKDKEINKLQTIVDHYNNHLFHYVDDTEIQLYLLILTLTNGEMRQWKTIWKGVEGEFDDAQFDGHFYEKAAWCRDTLYNKHLDALKANARLGNKKPGKSGLNLKLQWHLVDELHSFIKDCNRYLLNKLVILEVRNMANGQIVGGG
jgi:hypothetical protein